MKNLVLTSVMVLSLALTGCFGATMQVKVKDKKGNEYTCTTSVDVEKAKAEGKAVDLTCSLDVEVKK